MANEKRLIDADVLLKHLTNCIETTKGLFRSVCVAIKCFVEQMSTVDAVEVVHGRWEPHPRHPGFDRCSVCRDCIIGNDWADDEKWNYCPNCGAKMDGGTSR